MKPSTAASHGGGDGSASGLLRYWLPIALIAAAVWVSHADRRFATFMDDAALESVDLVEEVGGSNLSRQLLFPAIGLLGGILLWNSSRKPLSQPLLANVAVLLLVIVGASVLWSVEPSRSFRRASIVYFIAMAAVGIGRTWTATDLCRAALILSSLFVSVSILFELQAGSFLSGAEHRFAGAFHPNQQAVNTGILALSSLCLFRDSGRYRYLALAILGLVLTKLTGSRGCILGLVFAIGAMYWITLSRGKKLGSIIAGGMCLSLGIILFSLSDAASPDLMDIARMGRVSDSAQDEILNGRLAIWDEILGDISERPLLGYGYGAFWTSDRVFEYSLIRDWAFSSAHSVLLETILDVGIIGTLVAIALALITWITSMKVFSQTRDWGVMFIFTVVCMGMVSGLVDVMFIRVGFATILLAISIAILSMHSPRWPADPRGLGDTRFALRTARQTAIASTVPHGDFGRDPL